jgi:hypothetical protein
MSHKLLCLVFLLCFRQPTNNLSAQRTSGRPILRLTRLSQLAAPTDRERAIFVWSVSRPGIPASFFCLNLLAARASRDRPAGNGSIMPRASHSLTLSAHPREVVGERLHLRIAEGVDHVRHPGGTDRNASARLEVP